MISREPKTDRRASIVWLVCGFGLLATALCPLPKSWSAARAALDSARSTGLNRADRESNAAGYYEGLIGVVGNDGPRGELAQLLMGKPVEWGRFQAANVSRQLPGDPLLFELLPNVDRDLFGQRFTTNEHGMRDRSYTIAKPAGVYRIVVLGSSMDMGWGIDTESTYVNLLEDWLNAHAAERGLRRRFEVLNFAVAAYSPLQRLESFRRKAAAFQPDLVIYSATMLDPRLLEIQLCDMLSGRIEPRDEFVRRAFAEAGIEPQALPRDESGKLVNKEAIKTALRAKYWSILDDVLKTLAAECRARQCGLTMIVIPRVGKADAPDERAEPTARLHGVAARHAIPVCDLTDTFDGIDPARLEIAAWDDHPNAEGHRLLFQAIAHRLIENQEAYLQLFSDASQ